MSVTRSQIESVIARAALDGREEVIASERIITRSAVDRAVVESLIVDPIIAFAAVEHNVVCRVGIIKRIIAVATLDRHHVPVVIDRVIARRTVHHDARIVVADDRTGVVIIVFGIAARGYASDNVERLIGSALEHQRSAAPKYRSVHDKYVVTCP